MHVHEPIKLTIKIQILQRNCMFQIKYLKNADMRKYTSLQVGAELPLDSDDADEENKREHGKTLLCVFERG
jgi:hypothetical protein